MDNYKVLYLTEDVDNQAILKILTLNNTLDLDTATLSYYKKLATWANEQKAKIKNINLDTIELSDRSLIGKGISARTNSLLSTLNELNGKLAKKFDANNEISKKVQQMTVEILTGLSKIKNPNQTEENSNQENKQKLFAGMDWTAEKAQRLANANGRAVSEILDEFYNDYYKIEYAGLDSSEANDTTGIVTKLKSLNKVLITEFNKLGYNPEVNPFAQFLKNLIKNKYEIFEKLTFNTYGAIHNSFIEKNITGNMLGKYEVYADNNILYCNDLYNYSGLDIVNYLNLQKQVLDQIKGSSKYSKVKNLVAKIFIQQDIDGESYPEKIKNLQALENVITPGAAKAKLKSMLEIRELYKYLFGHEAKTKENNDDNVDKIVKATENDIILDMIYYLVSQYKIILKDENIVDINKWLKDFEYKQDKIKIEKSKTILSKYSKMESAKVVLTLIGKLQSKKRKETKNTA